jgi:hypothetical protein
MDDTDKTEQTIGLTGLRGQAGLNCANHTTHSCSHVAEVASRCGIGIRLEVWYLGRVPCLPLQPASLLTTYLNVVTAVGRHLPLDPGLPVRRLGRGRDGGGSLRSGGS